MGTPQPDARNRVLTMKASIGLSSDKWGGYDRPLVRVLLLDEPTWIYLLRRGGFAWREYNGRWRGMLVSRNRFERRRP